MVSHKLKSYVISLLLTRNLLLTITRNPMKILENLKGEILLDGSQLTKRVVFLKTADKILPLIFLSIFIGFRVIVSNKLRVSNKLILYVGFLCNIRIKLQLIIWS